MYKVNIKQHKNEVRFSSNADLSKGFFNKEPFDLNILYLEKNKFNVLYDFKNYDLKILNENQEEILIEINGKKFLINVLTPEQENLKKFNIHKSNKETFLRANMPGKVIKILVENNQKVNQGDLVLVLEAMKMENNIKINQPGIIKNIKVKEGDVVNKNDILLELE